MLKGNLKNNKAGILLYGLTPPKAEFDEQKLREISSRWTERINSVNADGLVLYEIQDESARMGERTFEFSDTLSPNNYYNDYLNVKTPSIFYNVANKYDEQKFREILAHQSANLSVFVGAASSKIEPKMSLNRAYEIARDEFKNLCVGGICIAERHAKKGDEEQRMAHKVSLGAKFFISQAVFDLPLAKELLNAVARANLNVPIIFTFTTCGTPKTLEFIKWLGINVPQNVEERLLKSSDILAESSKICVENFAQLYLLGQNLGVSVGANIESVMAKRAEIEASLSLVKEFRGVL